MTTAVLFEMQAFKGVTPLGASWQTGETLLSHAILVGIK